MTTLAIVCGALLLAGIALCFVALLAPPKCDRCGTQMEEYENGYVCPQCGSTRL